MSWRRVGAAYLVAPPVEVIVSGGRTDPPDDVGEDWGYLAYERGFDDACAHNEEESK